MVVKNVRGATVPFDMLLDKLQHGLAGESIERRNRKCPRGSYAGGGGRR